MHLYMLGVGELNLYSLSVFVLTRVYCIYINQLYVSIGRMSDEEAGKKDSKKYKELSRDRPSISFSLGRTKLKRHSEFTTNKNRKMPTSSPEVSSPYILW